MSRHYVPWILRERLFDGHLRVSLMAPGRPAISGAVSEWLRRRSDRLYVPAVAVAEIEQGIRKLRRAGGSVRADAYSGWLDAMIEDYGSRILPLDVNAARMSGVLADAAVAVGKHPGFPDIAIAAIAKFNELLILTRNVRHFEALGIAHADPFERLPD